MKNIDWQAFHDGSMSERERADVRNLIASDPHVKAEWQGFQNFQLQVKSALASERIPMARLDSMVHQVVQRHGPRFAPGPMVGMLVAGAVMSSFLFLNRTPDTSVLIPTRTMQRTDSPMQTMEMTDPKLARSWVQQKAGFDAPADLSGEANLYSVSASNRTVQYRYKVGNEDWLVKVCRASDANLPSGGVNTDGTLFIVQNSGFAFRTHGLAYEVSGPRREEAWKLAALTNKRCDASAPPPLKPPTNNICPK